jgi:predicted nucleotidyltransferase
MNDAPKEVKVLQQEIARDFPRILKDNLVGIYIWGSLTYDAFDEEASDIDCVVVLERDLDDEEFANLEGWFTGALRRNPWADKLDMRFHLRDELLIRDSGMCSYHFRKLERHLSDANPFIWINVARSGIALFGVPSDEIAPAVDDQTLRAALQLELRYLQEETAAEEGNYGAATRYGVSTLMYQAYSVLTACRIVYTLRNKTLVSKNQAAKWCMENMPGRWKATIAEAIKNRMTPGGRSNRELWNAANDFINFVGELLERDAAPGTHASSVPSDAND